MKHAPAGWRADLKATVPGALAEDARWLGNLNAETPWRCLVGSITLPEGHHLVMKWHHKAGAMKREHAAAQFMSSAGAPALTPELLGANTERKTLAFAFAPGTDLLQLLDTPSGLEVWEQAAAAVAALHSWSRDKEEEWLRLHPADAEPEYFPGYDLPDAELLAPFRGAGGTGLKDALAAVRSAVAHPGRWRGFIHGDLQTRHFIWNDGHLTIVDWECAGLGHTLFDLACLLAKPIGHGRRLPQEAVLHAVDVYAAGVGVDPRTVASGLAPVLAYEHWIGAAEAYGRHDAELRAELEGLVQLPGDAPDLAPLRRAAEALYRKTPAVDLPLCSGLVRR